MALIAVFGGTFDPPHLGHIQAVRDLMAQPDVAEVRILVSGQPPLKTTQTPAQHRLAMAQHAFGGLRGPQARVVTDAREIERARRQTGETTTYETLSEMRREFPRLAFVMGTDQVEGFPHWHRFPELLALCHWRVLARKPGGVERAQRALQGWAGPFLERESDRAWRVREKACGATPGREPLYLRIVETDAPEISSTRLREALAAHGAVTTATDPASMLSPAVLAYIRENRLYGAGPADEA